MNSFLIVSFLLFFIQDQSYATSNASRSSIFQVNQQKNYSFIVDYENDQFLLDGKPFRYVSGSFHYFRTPHQFWRDRLRKMRAAGLNAVSTYVEWSLHQPEIDQWNWEGDADLEKFIQLVQEEDLLLIFRPGPYICAERDFGGFPYWLLNIVPKGKLRTYNEIYMEYAATYLDKLFSRIKPYLRGNGGPIIMVQVENEYGSYNACDRVYTEALLRLFHQHIEHKAVLFTTDGRYYNMVKCGTIPGAYTTIDFGVRDNVVESFNVMRTFEPKGPLVNSEFYPGWLTHWNESLQKIESDLVVKALDKMLAMNASVNFYMFYGGTNFGFTSGANGGGLNAFEPQITSYDYDAPITEAGDITPKYLSIKNVIRKYLPIPNITITPNQSKGIYGIVQLKPVLGLLSSKGQELFGTINILTSIPPTFESLNLPSYLLLYETQVLLNRTTNSVLHAKVADRALVYLNNLLSGILSRTQKSYSVPLTMLKNSQLRILLENQGHLNYGSFISDYKGISNVTFENKVLGPWNCTGFRLQNVTELKRVQDHAVNRTGILNNGPMFLRGYFNVSGNPRDTYLDTSDWIKGVAYINGNNLGRYWPNVGPQLTLYVPSVFLRSGLNELVVLELEYIPHHSQMTLKNHSVFNDD